MPSKRYIIHIAPVAHMNGKLARQATVVHDNPVSDDSGGVSYYYGYQYAGRERSRYGLREKARNLSVNPYTAAETDNRVYFKTCINTVDNALQDPAKLAAATAAFKTQHRYVILRNYCIAMTAHNGGVFPF